MKCSSGRTFSGSNLTRLYLCPKANNYATQDPGRVSKYVASEEGQKLLFKVIIKDFYISSLNVMIDSKKRIVDIIHEIRKYEPSINQNTFMPQESIHGEVNDEGAMRNLNLEMPLEMLKTHTIYLEKKHFADEGNFKGEKHDYQRL